MPTHAEANSHIMLNVCMTNLDQVQRLVSYLVPGQLAEVQLRLDEVAELARKELEKRGER